MSPMAHPGSNRIVGALVVVAAFAWGTSFYGLGFYLFRLHDTRAWSLTALSNVVLIFYLAAVVLSFGVSKQLARRGPRPVMAVGAVAVGTALIAMPRVGDLASLVAVYLLLSLGWSCINANPISTTVMSWFEHGQRELSIALVGASFGGMIIIPLLGAADARYGFTTAVTMLGIVTTMVVGAAALLVIDRPPVAAETPTPAIRADRMAWQIMGEVDYWILTTGFTFAIVVQGGFLVHQLSILSETTSAARAAQVVGVTTLAALVGRFGPIVVGTRIAPAVVGAGYLLVQAVALAVLGLFEHSTTLLTMMSMMFGLGVGVLITMPSLLTRTTYTDLPYTSAYPVVNLGFQLSLAAGAPALAWLHDSFGGYRPAMWVLAIADLGAVILLLVNHRRTTTTKTTTTTTNPEHRLTARHRGRRTSK